MISGRGRRASAVALILVVALLGVCVIESAQVSAAEHHGCATLMTERAGTSGLVAKVPSGTGWAIVAQVGLPSTPGWPTGPASREDPRSLLPVPLDSQVSPRSPPASL